MRHPRRRTFPRLIVLSFIALAFALTSPVGDVAVLADGTDGDAGGLRAKRGYFSDLPFEQIDMLNGDLHLTVPLLTLSGNGGMNLSLGWSYNRNGTWSLGLAGVPIYIDYPDGPVEGHDMYLVTSDGSRHKAHDDGSGWYVTAEFWKYSPSTRTALFPNGWTATFESGTTVPAARLVEVHDAFGSAITPHWLDPGPYVRRLASVDHYTGGETRTVGFAWNDGRVQSMTFYGGVPGCCDQTWTFDWLGGSYPLSAIHPPDGPAWQFDYAGNPGSPTALTVTTPNGGTVSYSFVSESGRNVVRYRDTGGRAIDGGRWTFHYHVDQSGPDSYGVVDTPLGRHVQYRHHEVSDPDVAGPTALLTQTELTVDGVGGAVTQTVYEYTPLALTTSTTAFALFQETVHQAGWEFVTTYGFGSDPRATFHQPTSIDEHSDLTRTTALTYYCAFAVYRACAVDGSTVTINGDAIVSSFTYDTQGFRTGQTVAGVTTTFERDAGGNLATVTDADSRWTSFTYRFGVVASTTTPKASVTRTVMLNGAIQNETRAGNTTSYEYDHAGRVTRVSPPIGNPTETTYNGGGDWVAVSRGPTNVTSYVDGFGRATGTLSVSGIHTRIAYDVEGRKTFQSQAYTTTELGDYFTYDGLNRVTQVQHTDQWNSAVHYTYGATDVQVTDEDGKNTLRHGLAFGRPSDLRLASVTDAAGQTWSYSYNVFGSLTRVDAPEGPDRIWAYNSKGRLESDTQPESGTTTYTYHANGNLATRTDAKGQMIEYSYDTGNRLTLINAPGTADDQTLYYDDAGNRCTVVVGGQITYYAFDAVNRLKGVYNQVPGQWQTYSYDYDDNGNVATIGYPSGRTVTYGYDAEGRVTSVQGPAVNYAANVSYHPSGALAGYQLGNGQWRSVSLNARGQTAHITSGPLDLTYGYDASGNVSYIGDPREDHSQWFGYDALDRLQVKYGFGSTDFEYDALGNRTRMGLTTYTYDGASSRLMQATGGYAATYAYDPNGNMTQDDQGTYAYDAFNRLITATVAGNDWTYQYDADGRRIKRSRSNGPEQLMIHGAGGELLSEYDFVAGQPVWTRDSIYLGGQLLATVGPATAPLTLEDLVGTWWIQGSDEVWRAASIADEGGGALTITNEWGDVTHGTWDAGSRTVTAGEEWGNLVNDVVANAMRLKWRDCSCDWVRSPTQVPDDSLTFLYYHTDALGSVRVVSDQAGQTMARYDYGAFGEGPGTTSASEKARFAGTERDAESFLDYMGARYYRNVTGRFTSVDPIFSAGARTDPQRWNRYAYALNGPVRLTDTTGLDADDRESDDRPLFADYGGADSVGDFEEFIRSYYADHDMAYYCANGMSGQFGSIFGQSEMMFRQQAGGSGSAGTPPPPPPEHPIMDAVWMKAADASAGAGDLLSFSGTYWYRKWRGSDSAVRTGGWTYFTGGVFGGVVSLPLFSFAGGAEGLLSKSFLNHNNFARLGWGWSTQGQTFRFVVGAKNSFIHAHLDLYPKPAVQATMDFFAQVAKAFKR